MNVLIVIPFYTPNIVGGAEISNQIIAEGLVKRGHQVNVLTLGENSSKERREQGVLISYMYDATALQIWKKV